MTQEAVKFLNELQKGHRLKSKGTSMKASGKERTERWLELLGCEVNAPHHLESRYSFTLRSLIRDLK